jgi:RNA 2',3'-cyclic 3'-phosphodiesterase
VVPLKPTDRLFFALFPDDDAGERMGRLTQRLCEEHRLKGKPPAADRLHLTLCHLGDFAGLRPDYIDLAVRAAASIVMPPIEVMLDRVTSFERRRKLPLVLLAGASIPTLESFQRDLAEALRHVGLDMTTEYRFKPHVPLLYDNRAVVEQLVDAIGWTAREFVLVHSLLGQSRHMPLARWGSRDP